jgi:nitrite reductase (NO-forming)
MQRTFFYMGLVGGGMAAFLSLVLVGSLLVSGSRLGTVQADTGSTASHAMSHEQPAARAVEPDPDASPYELRDASAPPALEGIVHDIDLVVVERPMTVAEGFVQTVYAFGTTVENATVPGPVIRVTVGDTVRIHLKNPATNAMPHSVDFHASMVAWNDEMTDINPGEEKLYEFTADYAGVFMYHCGTAGALSHMLNGMYGLIIVEPAGGLEPVDREVFLIQNEWYLGQQGQTGDLERANATVPDPDYVVFNGIANQYKDNPISVETGETVRAFVLNVGPNIDSSFHVVGTIFNRVVKEGIELARGNEGNWGSQAVDLAPAQGAIVEFSFAEDGLYPIVTHAFNFVAHGAIGLFQAGDGDPLN